ncbi:hypothetical protein JKF63_03901 [Porcisia hertigi]|uniref:Uncharacterized protein n=1 Tax=Porcisia hertigi TaxID=2761500 RepID=A0A836IHB7_9TRYP|nr:hypothetical protein JKF63_03901 [Porcisia hertigi]
MRATSVLVRRASHQDSHPWWCIPTSRLFPNCSSAPCSAPRCVHAPAPTLKACMSTLCPRRHFSSDNGDLPSPTTAGAAATNSTATYEEEDDDLKVDIYRSRVSPEEAERKAKTDLFLCLLLTLPRDQDWKDMLAAAFRAGTWKPHHLDAVLRGVQLNKYNAPNDCALSCSGNHAASLSPSRSAALRDSIADVAKNAPTSSTASTRLQRARDILVFCAEEGGVYAAPAGSSLVDVSAAPSSQGAEQKGRRSHDFAPSPAAAHRLLVLLLQAAQRGADATSSSESNATSQPVASFHDVWNFLAWMELHGYHILSGAVLDALEAVIDEGGIQVRSGAAVESRRAAGPSSSSSSAASPPVPHQYAMMSQRVHRLDYLRVERALLCESMKNAEQVTDGVAPGTGPLRREKRGPDLPRTAPVDTE